MYSAGCGRTGTIIVLDYIWNMLKCGVSIGAMLVMMI